MEIRLLFNRLMYHLKTAFLLCLCICTLCFLILSIEDRLHFYAALNQLSMTVNESDDFRACYMTEDTFNAAINFAAQENLDLSEVITVTMIENDFDLSQWNYKNYSRDTFDRNKESYIKHTADAYENLLSSYKSIWDDLVYYPVVSSTNSEIGNTAYDNSWLFERNYGGTRGHEGTDIMPPENTRDYYPIISMTDGYIEKIGWLEQGGWRIGIRSKSGAYFYYAHLSEYAQDFQIGDEIKAGDLLGFMGDTGYSKIEGTTGNFDVHLHLGIYIVTENHTELSINPYWILRYTENNMLKYSY